MGETVSNDPQLVAAMTKLSIHAE